MGGRKVNADGDVPEEKNKAEAEPPTVTENPLQRVISKREVHYEAGNECREDAHAFYHQLQLNELKRLATGIPRPILEIYDELASDASTSLAVRRDTHDFWPGGRICGLLPSRRQRNPSNCWCWDGTH
ncbi:Hepatoma-derived growth factor-related protein [Trichinella spiralis]|uniref:Hepatoma-derived growth factor-related protein n=1 Tax=Trichinella spiralis TaxID=6334 RepID=A0ABR3K1Y7_TRISP